MPLPLLLLSSPLDFAGEHEMVEAMFAAGLACFHLRKPGATAGELERWLLALDSQWRSRVVVHGAPEVAESCGLAGCHMPLDWYRSGILQRGEHAAVPAWSVSLHSFAELDECPAGISKAFLSPIFDSISKQGYQSAFTATELRSGLALQKAKHGESPQVFALGGVESDNLELVALYGFAGAAVLGSVWHAPDPLGACVDLLHCAEVAHAV